MRQWFDRLAPGQVVRHPGYRRAGVEVVVVEGAGLGVAPVMSRSARGATGIG
jgi:hypothetical protein